MSSTGTSEHGIVLAATCHIIRLLSFSPRQLRSAVTLQIMPRVADAIAAARSWVNTLVVFFNTWCSLTLTQPG